MKLSAALFASAAAAAGVNGSTPSIVESLLSSIPSNVVKGPFNPFPTQFINSYKAPIQAILERNAYVARNGSELLLSGTRWTAAGANVYWLGLDENVQPAAGQPFYAPYNASYPTKGRITEIMNTLQVLGGRTIRSQTLGVSVGNPLSVMPKLGEVNEQAFDTIDWAVYQARQHGIRVFAPLVSREW
ncbi:glycoside hydrolase family 5 protein [Glonium stellatum]|uniref:Glycoside hydrolase family 5 protein n=1 Tax=Glonium stellatum TaxID=574774 RepID=A0A8E2EX43_9PEZI|nr:glycoside hydrolase family 5 protein [Glonium stellatum]